MPPFERKYGGSAKIKSARIWAKNRFHRGAPQLWKSGPISGLQGSERAGAFASMASPVVCSVLNHIFMPDIWKRVCPTLFRCAAVRSLPRTL
jgi:hypothetical protein